jgi:hypothetical protein
MACGRDGHEANDLDDTKTCFLEESLLFDYNPTLDTSAMYTDFPAEDRGASTSTPTVGGETSSSIMAQEEHGMQGNQAVSNWGLSTL